jgi:tRNA-uridine 2-sulfurtransferase
VGKSQKRVVVAMSGGVDSSVAAATLVARGFEVIGMSFRLWLDCDLKSISDLRSCCSQRDMEAVGEVAKTLGIKHTIIDLRDLFFSRVVEPFAREYTMGHTPNPCEACNRRVKFPILIEAADDLGAEYVATGHYARVERVDGAKSSLLRAAATNKDQSYALYGLGQEELRHCIFPNGDLSKGEIREAASARGLATAEKPESQEICFISGGDYRDFLAARFPEAFSPGPICDSSGNELGAHDGIAFYTIGQRRGLGISASHPLYVIALERPRRAVVLGRKEEVPGEWLRAEAAHWIKGEAPQDSFKAEVMARYNTVPLPCRVEVEGNAFEVFFEKRAWALTPGQHAVLYRGDEVLGGGVIASVR